MTEPAAVDADAAAILVALARAHPEPADVAFEACVLGFHARRMEQALRELAQAGLVVLNGGGAVSDALPPQQAALTQRGLAVLGATSALGVEASGRVGRRRSPHDVPHDRRCTPADRRSGNVPLG